MWYVIPGVFLLGFALGAPFCWKAYMRRRAANSTQVITIRPELEQLHEFVGDLKGLQVGLQTTAQLLAQRAAASNHEKDTSHERRG